MSAPTKKELKRFRLFLQSQEDGPDPLLISRKLPKAWRREIERHNAGRDGRAMTRALWKHATAKAPWAALIKRGTFPSDAGQTQSN